MQKIAQAKLPVLLVIEHLYLRRIAAEQDLDLLDGRLCWFQQGYTQHSDATIYLAELTRYQIAAFRVVDSQGWAADLHSLTDGIPDFSEALLHHWQTVDLAFVDAAGCWHIAGAAADVFPGGLYDQLIHTSDLTAACEHLAAAAQFAQQFQHPLLDTILELQAKRCTGSVPVA